MIHVKRGGRYAAPFVICGNIVQWKHCEISGYSERKLCGLSGCSVRKALWYQQMQNNGRYRSIGEKD